MYAVGSYTEGRNITFQILYRDLSRCPPPPKYLPGFKPHCWKECEEEEEGKNCRWINGMAAEFF